LTARRWFHVLLGAAFLPCLSLPLVWMAAVKEWRTAGPDRRWAARLLALAIVDTLVAVAIIGLTSQRDDLPAAGNPVRRLVIGVAPDPASKGPGVRLGTITPGGPAEKAGLRVGDVIESVDGEVVSSLDELRREVGNATPDEPLELGIRRDASVFTVEADPVWSDQMPRQRRGLFQPDPAGESCVSSFGGAWKPVALEIALLAVLAVAGWRGGAGAGVWLTMLALVVGTGGALAGWMAPCLVVGGPSAGGVLLTMWGTSLGLVLTGLAGRAWVRPPPIVASRSVLSTVLLGAWYAVTGAIRLAIVLGALRLLLHSTPLATPIDLFAPAVQSAGPGLLVLAVGAVVLAPLGEELVFRGMLLPALVPWAGTTAALWISALIFGGLHWYYGVMTPVIVLFGWVLGWARIASGGLLAPVLLHALINLLPVAVTALRH
jgi:membrane protease YdiL (CAAX protease family)